ncbi:MAG: alpha/beta hydrolase [Pseudomonadota bacterium]
MPPSPAAPRNAVGDVEMPILRLNAGPDGVSVHGSPAPLARVLRSAARGTGPVMVLVHGYKYDPTCLPFDPHEKILGLATAAGWLRPLGFGLGDPDEGLAIAFGWRARGTIWRAQSSARAAGRHLARVIRDLRTLAPGRPIHAITHSMGSEVVFEAVHHLHAGDLGRIVTLAGASYASRAVAAMHAAAGRTAELFNVTSRENDLFDVVFERLLAPDMAGDRAIGSGIDLPNVVNLQLDCPATLAALPRFGGVIAPPGRTICHWSSYTRAGALPFYAHALRHPQAVPLDALRAALPARAAPRWSRMFAPRPRSAPLPMGQKTAS